ncbi:MAG: homocysteine S-methyltransferase family protein [Anaerolineae bacterium]
MPETLRQHLLSEGVLVADGATGTMLQAAGLTEGTAPESWNLTHPEEILSLHRAYVEAGSQIILTNSFGGSRFRLGKKGLEDKVREVNRAAAALAKEAAGQEAFVAGSMGPTGELMRPLGTLSYVVAVEAFTEQAEALAEGGVDAIVVETMSDLNEAKAAIEGAKRAADLPVLCTLSFDTQRHTMMGVSPRRAVREMWPLGLDAIGGNCGRTLDDMEEVLRQMRAAVPEATLMAKPNAGLPHLVDGQAVYDVTPQVMAEYALRYAELGAKIVGGCCGSTPAHIKAMAAALGSLA